ncbi:glycosyltransferase [Chitinophaga sancti]|uniref:Glycosyl transferase family 2 n=1 Tax=Chitinophaga sancti TaxID=1004 RepID=A0A1K1T1Y6_9BACT|nr:glycosyltransferase [Chitinophaga sancti]WQD59626.1 glycosyltransferase [Chitinophaga sancti]WQG88243.1 glycosyltransferase [Chitinophaga sancti]SFW90534.1 Glycosyl transferase family 2 [Chitinophaga sancti]
MRLFTIIIPCYNEGQRLSICEYQNFLSSNKDCIIFVNDGSTDNTLLVLTNFLNKFPQQVLILNLPNNVGKAEAIRLGVLLALKETSNNLIGFMDADLATPFSEVEIIKYVFSQHNYKMIFGSRILRIGAHIHRFNTRHYLGRVMATLVSIYLDQPIYDSQCGAKFFEPEIANKIFIVPFVSRWLFDVEIFKRFLLLGYSLEDTCYELPLHTWIEKGGSKISIWDFIKLPIEFVNIFLHYPNKDNCLDYRVLYQD